MEKIKVFGMEERTSQKGSKYKVFHTDRGDMSAFETELIAEMEKHVNGEVEVEFAERNGFKNLIKVGQVSKQSTGAKGFSRMDPTTMYVSYAKDIFIAIWNSTSEIKDKEIRERLSRPLIMEEAIKLVKQAKEGLKE